MLLLLQWCLLLALLGSLAFWGVSRWICAPVVAIILLGYSIYSHLSWFSLIAMWLLYIAASVLFLYAPLRLRLITKPLLAYVRATLPPMSQTEREAIEAGDVWWEGELFQGNPNWKSMLATPAPQLTAAEQAFLDNQVTTLCSMVDDWKVLQEDREIPKAVFDYIRQERFWGMVIDKKYGGLGFSALAHALIVTKIASRSVSVAVTVMVPNSLGPGELLSKYGTDQQKQYYLPRLVHGDEVPCFALTAPDAGSDAAAMPDTGIIEHGEWEGKRIIGIRLNWNKRYITLAPIATVLGLAFKLYDPQHLLGEQVDRGITLCLIPTNHAGVEIGHRHLPLMLTFMNGPTRGRNVFIPLDWVIGGPEMIGKGWRMLMECLSIGRSVSLPAVSTASGQIAFRTTGAYTRIRKQFRVPIGNFEGVQEPLARIGGFTYMLNAMQLFTAHAVDQGFKPAIASAIAKYHMTEMARMTVNHALDIHGGRGIQFGPRNYLGHGYLAIPMSITVEGANILTRNLIIFGQGAIRCHPYIYQEMQIAAATDQEQAVTDFDNVLLKHLRFIITNTTRTLAYGLSGGHLIWPTQSGKLARYLRQLTRMSAALAMTSNYTMLFLGGALKRKERLSARLGDVLSYLYMASAVIKYHHDQQSPAEDLPFVEWCLQYCLYQIQQAFYQFFANFPVKIVAVLLKRMIFPWGQAYHMPRDRLDQSISKVMMHPSALRDRMTQNCLITQHASDPYYRLETALQTVIAADSYLKKMQNAMRAGNIPAYLSIEERIELAVEQQLLTAEEAAHLREYEKARQEAIAVDEFAFDYFKNYAKQVNKSYSSTV